MNDNGTDATPVEQVVDVLRLADAGWPGDRTDFDARVVGFAGWNGYLDHDAKVTEAGRRFLGKFGPLFPEVDR